MILLATAPKASPLMWFGLGFIPCRFAYCPSKVAWDKEMARLGLSEPYPRSDGHCSTFQKGDEPVVSIVTFSDEIQAKAQKSLNGFIGILNHEAMHVWQHALEDIGEDKPSSEFEAYAVQEITTDLLHAFGCAHRIRAFRYRTL